MCLAGVVSELRALARELKFFRFMWRLRPPSTTNLIFKSHLFVSKNLNSYHVEIIQLKSPLR